MTGYKELILEELKQVDREGMDDLINYLLGSDYFTAPASGAYHMNVPGGLAYHSWHVYKLLDAKNKLYKLGLSQDTVRITALLHDFCKIGVRTIETKMVKNSEGRWVARKVWGYKDNEPLGHGEKSVILLQRYIKLSAEEQMMIRWHMLFTEELADRRTLGRVLELYPSVGALHAADSESGWFYEYVDRDLKELNGEGRGGSPRREPTY